ncbi:single-stranded DNA-binding protein [Kribbella monticola]|uniref:single-stranded DNA-binding protein n=1 Tax=Kribbella monticola TaxID=2185285 RepID=UPI001300204D|nr:single-stranded DNA-binding protein [Kribbella monticola]
MSETYLAVQGWVGSDIRLKEVSEGVSVASFRLAATPQQYVPANASWVDRPTNWFTVECWRALAVNVCRSIERGHPVLVTGRFRTTEWQDEAGNPKSRTVIEATSVGHDLSKGAATFTRTPSRAQFRTPTDQAELPETPADEAHHPDTPTQQAA